ncbi:MAG: hypothetical protein COX20_00395 [Desulfobacterales bacterium CG23_combo_of_CG06-09_8_20_14_all_52_9]|nr:MAG: hypothetical protein COX20_00395 [Desulfobacterales bacterium CG23_combo_of_CG06-09_8_20_14_all_52_9]
MKSSSKKHVACFISAHGFGHASRTTAILEHLIEMDDAVHFHLFTTVPRWFFDFPLSKRFTYHSTVTDVGFVQRSPFLEDLEETARLLDAFFPFDPRLLDSLAEKISEPTCRAVLCDISPLGIAVAKKAGFLSVLVENFTWDWLYAGYPDFSQKVKRHIDYLNFLFNTADHRIQTEPVCCPATGCPTLPPISRKPRTNPQTVRKHLGIPDEQALVLITLGGIPDQMSFLSRLKEAKDFQFIIAGGSDAGARQDNVWLLPHQSDLYHPDLVFASDGVIGKAGYSTLAEVYSAGIPFGFIPRPDFAESLVLSDFIEKKMPGRRIPAEIFYAGDWVPQLKEWIKIGEKRQLQQNGAWEAARLICDLLNP